MIREVKVSQYNGVTGTMYSPKLIYITFEKTLLEVERFLESPRTLEIRDKSNIYFSKSVKFPRVKFREWVYTRDINIKRNVNKSNYCIIDISKIEGILKEIRDYAKEITLCKNAAGQFIMFQKDSIYKEDYEMQGFPKTIKETTPLKLRVYSHMQSNISIINEVVELAKLEGAVEIIDVTDMINTTSNDVTIDASNVGDIISIIQSQDNRDLGLELMYNSNYSKSLFFLCFIIANCHSSIDMGRSSVNKTTFFSYLNAIKIDKQWMYKFKYGLNLDNMNKFLKSFKDINLYHMVDRKFIKDYMIELVNDRLNSSFNGLDVEVVDFNIHCDELVDPLTELDVNFENVIGNGN